MRIAFASYEYPGETGGGGIGTYLQTVASALHGQGHSVVVFTATGKAAAYWENDFVYRIPATGWLHFNDALPSHFTGQHQQQPFDVIECTDFQAAGLSVKKLYPQLPTVVRLHTPLYLVDRLLHQPLSVFTKARFILGGLRRLKLGASFPTPQAADYTHEFELIKLAERISTPSSSIAKELSDLGFDVWGKADLIPLGFESGRFCGIPVRDSVNNKPHIVFIGRLEMRKGVTELATAIPSVLRELPGAHFSFIGRPAASPKQNVDMTTYLREKLSQYKSAVSFTGAVSPDALLSYMADGDIFVFPSHYESFGLACCEAMATGKAVIGSRSGGMAEIIEEDISGVLVEPKQPEQLARAIIDLARDDQKRLALGRNARQRIKDYLSPDVVLPQQMSCYQKAIAAVTNRVEVAG